MRKKLVIGPAHLILGCAALCFMVLVVMSGWTWPLDGVAAMLPVAAYLVFS